jgi:hypothetical protein
MASALLGVSDICGFKIEIQDRARHPPGWDVDPRCGKRRTDNIARIGVIKALSPDLSAARAP